MCTFTLEILHCAGCNVHLTTERANQKPCSSEFGDKCTASRRTKVQKRRVPAEDCSGCLNAAMLEERAALEAVYAAEEAAADRAARKRRFKVEKEAWVREMLMREMVHEFDDESVVVHCDAPEEDDLNDEDSDNDNETILDDDDDEEENDDQNEVEMESNFTQEQAVRDVYDREIPLEMYFLQLQFGNPGHAYYSQYEEGKRYGFYESW